MEKQKSIKIDFDLPLNLYREDLIEIEDILVKELGANELKILFGKYSVTKIEEIPLNQDDVSEIEFRVPSPYLVLRVGKHPTIYAGDNSLLVVGAIAKIKNIFNRSVSCQSKIMGILSNLLLLMGIVVFFVAIGFSELIFNGIPLLLISALSIIFAHSLHTKKHSHIEFEFKNIDKNFWIKNKDQIYVGLFVSIPVALISFVLGKFL